MPNVAGEIPLTAAAISGNRPFSAPALHAVMISLVAKSHDPDLTYKAPSALGFLTMNSPTSSPNPRDYPTLSVKNFRRRTQTLKINLRNYAYEGSGREDRENRPAGVSAGRALVIAILVLSILTVVGIALMLVTSTESRIAANEWSVNRAFYASDAGIRWGTVEMANPQDFLRRPEFTGQPFGTVFFQLPSHRNTLSGLFLGDQTNPDIAVRIQTPSMMGRRHALGRADQ